MPRKKPKPLEPATKRNAAEKTPENDLGHCIFYLVTYGGSSLDELAEATGLDRDTVDLYMLGRKLVSRELVEQFCKVAGTTLPRVELALPILYWTFGLLDSKKRPSKEEIEREGRVQRQALEMAFAHYDDFLDELMASEIGGSEADYHSMAGVVGSVAGEAYRQAARAILARKLSSPGPDDELGEIPSP
jgi:transcriptional regulator with XRE-family HTH domain